MSLYFDMHAIGDGILLGKTISINLRPTTSQQYAYTFLYLNSHLLHMYLYLIGQCWKIIYECDVYYLYNVLCTVLLSKFLSSVLTKV